MCGISGINSPDRNIVRRMNEAVRHRGPDDEGIFVDDRVALGNCRLKVIDLSPSGHQPMSNETGDVWITFNGEIYNYQELAKKLISLGHRFKSKSDTEVIIHGYEQWGIDVLQKLVGMWAFAIYDRLKGRLFLSRDPTGIKPLYYLHKGDVFAFSSELKTFAIVSELRQPISRVGLSEVLLYGFNPSFHTMLSSVRKLGPGQYLEFDLRTGKMHIASYWLPLFDQVENPNIGLIMRSIEQAVKRHLISDVPVGCYVSGGIDSSVVAIYYARHYPNTLHTFTVGFEGTSDEREYARILADYIGSHHHEKVIPAEEVAKNFDKLIYYYDLSITDGAFIPNYLISKEAKRFVTVVLAGEGGDELFAGYDHYRVLYAAQRFGLDRIAKALPVAKVLRPLILRSPVKSKDRLLRGYHLLEQKNTPDFVRYYYAVLPEEQTKILGIDLGHPNSDDSPLQIRQNELISRILEIDQRVLLAENYNYKADKSTSAASLEERVPLQDKELVEYVNRIPLRFKLNFRVGKILLREVLRRELPELSVRKKHGYGTPIELWLRSSLCNELEIAVRDRLIQRVLDKDALGSVYSKFVSSHDEDFPSSYLFFLWNVLIVSHSLRRYWYHDIQLET